jgi:hypothetical protein
MNQDRELLELAGKAAGIPTRIIGAAPGSYGLYPDTDGVDKFCCVSQWNPSKDDGDCARLEAALGLNVTWCSLHVFAESNDGLAGWIERYSSHNGDKQAARRMASLRAAAEIGRTMS